MVAVVVLLLLTPAIRPLLVVELEQLRAGDAPASSADLWGLEGSGVPWLTAVMDFGLQIFGSTFQCLASML